MAHDTRITSRKHPLVQRLRAAARRETAECLLDGPHLLAEAVQPPARLRTTLRAVVVTHAALDKVEVAAACDEAAAQGIPVHLVPDALATAISPAQTPTGVVALADVAAADLGEVLGPAPSLIVVLAGVQDPGNVGAVIRTAEAAGATGVVALPGTADPCGWKALRASMGSALRLPIVRPSTGEDVVAALRAHGVTIVAADGRPDAPGDALPEVGGPLALLIGAEGAGLPAALRRAADATVSIDLAPPVESLNAGVAAALILFEIRRLRAGASSIVRGPGR